MTRSPSPRQSASSSKRPSRTSSTSTTCARCSGEVPPAPRLRRRCQTQPEPAAYAARPAGSPRKQLLRQLPQALGLRERLQLLEGVVLDLADALAGDAEGVAHLLQGQRLVPAEAVAKLDHLALALGQSVEGALDVGALEVLGRALERLLGGLVRDEVAELRLLLVADRLLQRDRHLGDAQDVA